MARYIRFDEVFGVTVQEAAEMFKQMQCGAGEYTRHETTDDLLRCEYCGVATDKKTGLCKCCGAPLNPRA